ncbi:hypothetical protein GE09DRAFT_1228084 [Coniochaeta sp. 2T2.1]|nr:hypothetical protein GE09DRAFT_1228084 [Coniochaeta sp. 2T2.1]
MRLLFLIAVTALVAGIEAAQATLLVPPAKRKKKRAIANSIPYYASVCGGEINYSSACSCAGVTAGTVSATVTPVITITVSETYTTTTEIRTTTVETESSTSSTTETTSTTVSTETATATLYAQGPFYLYIQDETPASGSQASVMGHYVTQDFVPNGGNGSASMSWVGFAATDRSSAGQYYIESDGYLRPVAAPLDDSYYFFYAETAAGSVFYLWANSTVRAPEFALESDITPLACSVMAGSTALVCGGDNVFGLEWLDCNLRGAFGSDDLGATGLGPCKKLVVAAIPVSESTTIATVSASTTATTTTTVTNTATSTATEVSTSLLPAPTDAATPPFYLRAQSFTQAVSARSGAAANNASLEARQVTDFTGQYIGLVWVDPYNPAYGWTWVAQSFATSPATRFYIDFQGYLRPYDSPVRDGGDEVYMCFHDSDTVPTQVLAMQYGFAVAGRELLDCTISAAARPGNAWGLPAIVFETVFGAATTSTSTTESSSSSTTSSETSRTEIETSTSSTSSATPTQTDSSPFYLRVRSFSPVPVNNRARNAAAAAAANNNTTTLEARGLVPADVTGQYAVLAWEPYNVNSGWQAKLTPFTASPGVLAGQFYIDGLGNLRPFVTPLGDGEDPVYLVYADRATPAPIEVLQRGMAVYYGRTFLDCSISSDATGNVLSCGSRSTNGNSEFFYISVSTGIQFSRPGNTHGYPSIVLEAVFVPV